MKPHRTHEPPIYTTLTYSHASENSVDNLPGYIVSCVGIRWAQDCHALMEFLAEGLVSFLDPHQNSVEAISSHTKS